MSPALTSSLISVSLWLWVYSNFSLSAFLAISVALYHSSFPDSSFTLGVHPLFCLPYSLLPLQSLDFSRPTPLPWRQLILELISLLPHLFIWEVSNIACGSSLLPKPSLSSSDSFPSFLLNVAFPFPQIPPLSIIQTTLVCNFYAPVNFLLCINWFSFFPSPLHICFHSVGPLHHVFLMPVADHCNPEGVCPTTINSRSSVYKKQPTWLLMHAEHAQNPWWLHLHSSDLHVSKCGLSNLAKLWWFHKERERNTPDAKAILSDRATFSFWMLVPLQLLI